MLHGLFRSSKQKVSVLRDFPSLLYFVSQRVKLSACYSHSPSQLPVQYEEMVKVRRLEAKRSIIVQVSSINSSSSLFEFCSKYGNISSMHHYALKKEMQFIVVEFSLESDVKKLLSTCSYIQSNQVVPVQSPFLWFQSTNEKSTQHHINVETAITNEPCENFVMKQLQGAESMSEQILMLYKSTSLNDLGIRLRFLTTCQLEQALSGLFPDVRFLPFGSSVNGFGKLGCDLDMMLDFSNNFYHKNNHLPFAFQGKHNLSNSKRLIETIADICHLFLTGVSQVTRILNARVPIIKYRHNITGVDCDLCVSNKSAISMTGLLYQLASYDDRVQPLTNAIRAWAQNTNLTKSVPGAHLTNFSLILLVIFFLQQKLPHSLLPALNQLVPGSLKKITNSVHKRNSHNGKRLQELFIDFFKFYSEFDFEYYGINVLTGVKIIKPQSAPLYIVNPVESHLNVSKNMSLAETLRMQHKLRETATLFDSNNISLSHVQKCKQWGLIKLFYM